MFIMKKEKLWISDTLAEFNHIYKEFNDIYHETAWKLKLSDSVFSILYALCEMGEGCLQKDICAVTCLPKQTVNSSIRKMEAEDLVTMEKGKGREMKIHLTEKGMELLQEKLYPVIEAENKAFSSMTEEECRQLLDLYRKHCKALQCEMKKIEIVGGN